MNRVILSWSTHLCSSLSICLAREILFLMDDMKATSTGKESRSFPETKRKSNVPLKKITRNLAVSSQTPKCRLTWFVITYCWFALTWSIAMFFTENKGKRLHNNRLKFPEDLVGAPRWPPFLCLGAPTWRPWRHVKTENSFGIMWIFDVGRLFHGLVKGLRQLQTAVAGLG